MFALQSGNTETSASEMIFGIPTQLLFSTNSNPNTPSQNLMPCEGVVKSFALSKYRMAQLHFVAVT